MSTSDERFYKRKLNEMEQDIKRLQREIQKLKALRRHASRSQKHTVRALQRELDIQDVFDDIQAEQFQDLQKKPAKEREAEFHCRNENCGSDSVQLVLAGTRTIVICQDCSKRYTIKANDEYAKLA